MAIIKVVRKALSLLKSPLLQIYRSKGDFSFRVKSLTYALNEKK
nr:MAG TPA: hypothetical protein [Caudoviricetes sp.]